MEVRRELVRFFDYDLWSNLRWLPLCAEEPMRSVMAHLIRAQVIWLERVGGQTHFAVEDPGELLEVVSQSWRDHLATANLDEVIHYQNALGQKFAQPRLDIVRHVLNHGTYHRGQLRGMAELLGFPDFPETDYIFFLRELDA